MRAVVLVGLLAACGASGPATGHVATLRPACAAGSLWNGTTCAHAGDFGELPQLAEGIEQGRLQDAEATLATVAKRGPFEHANYVALWEQRAIAKAFVQNDPAAAATSIDAFDMVLALDPRHVLPYKMSPQATLKFEQ